MTYPKKFRHFLLPRNQLKAVEEVETEYAKYNIAPNTFTTSLSQMRSINDMLQDPIISSAVSLQMETAFQTDDDQHLFSLHSDYNEIRRELDAFHRDIDIDNICLTLGYNLILWGNLPIQFQFDSSKRLIGATLIGDFTSVTPIILGGVTAGFVVDGEYKFPFEYYYAQSQHYKNLGGPYSNVSSYVTLGENEVRNEFVYSPSYLSSASKPWRNVNIIEDALLLARMDQSNYYRIISVDVPGAVNSKAAIQTLNYYRNIFKKVRRVSYDPAGMSARGVNQEFEVIVPRSQSGGVSVDSVGGNLDIKALKDLDTQYSRLFASLRVNSPMIGFDSDTPGTLNGEGPGLLWDERFGKLCKALLHSVFRAVRAIDYTFLRSRGYSVTTDDWRYNIPAMSLLADRQRAELLETSVKTLESLTRQFKDNEVEFNKKYLFTSVLGTALSLSGVDVATLFDAEEKKEVKRLGSSFYASSNPLEDSQKKVLVASKLLDEAEGQSTEKRLVASSITPSIKGSAPINDLLFETKVYSANTPVDISSICYSTSSTIQALGKPRKKVTFATVPIPSSVLIPADVDVSFTVGEISKASIGCLDNLHVVGSSVYISSREDLKIYFALLASGNQHCVVSNYYEF